MVGLVRVLGWDGSWVFRSLFWDIPGGLNTVASNGWRMGNQDGSAIAGPGNKK